MVRRMLVEAIDEVPRPIVAVGNDYPEAHAIAPHKHRRGQLLTSVEGVLVVTTPLGAWLMPPQRGMWIPPSVMHDVRTLGAVQLQSLYLAPEMTDAMPDHCQVVGISPFMRNLIAEAIDLPVDYDPDSRAGALMTLIQHELRALPALPLSLPYPTHGRLAEKCRQFLGAPTITETIEDWREALSMSRRAFTRMFRRETGTSFVEWRQQACLIAALPRLASGQAVTSVALDLGYDNPAAFTTMFKRVLGASPRAYLKANG